MTTRERYRRTIEYFTVNMPVAETELTYTDPFGLIVAVILSAQCTDKRVNMITPALLERYPDAESMALAEQDQVFDYIKSCSYQAYFAVFYKHIFVCVNIHSRSVLSCILRKRII